MLDEPTNDLDLETLDMLTEMLSKYRGTLLIVSHDRDFLDQTVNKILYFDLNGKVTLFLGGYSDFIKSQNNLSKENKFKKTKNIKKKQNISTKLSYKHKYELEKLPKEISDIQEKLNQITKELKQSNLYIDNYDRYVEITKKMEDLNKKLSLKEDKWLEVLELEDKINKKNNE